MTYKTMCWHGISRRCEECHAKPYVRFKRPSSKHTQVLSALIIIVEQINTLQVHVHVSIKYFTQIKQS
jgi:hypothetical protein